MFLSLALFRLLAVVQCQRVFLSLTLVPGLKRVSFVLVSGSG